MIPSHHLSLKLIQQCPACARPFQRAHVTTLAETDTTVLAHLQCVSCEVNLLANVVQMPQGLVGNALLTDATVSEIEGILDTHEIHEDDFLKIYQLIQTQSLIHQIHESSAPDSHAVGEADSLT